MDSHKARSGFTLLEVILALAVAALLFAGLTTFIFGMGEAWGRNADARLFDRHVRNSGAWLQALLDEAALAPARGEPREGEAVEQPEVREIPLPEGGTVPALVFSLAVPPERLPWPQKPLPDVDFALVLTRGEGLRLLWHSRLEVESMGSPYRDFPVSQWVSALHAMYDEPQFSRWGESDGYRREGAGVFPRPDRIRLTYEYEGRQAEVVLVLPPGDGSIPGGRG